MGDKKTFIVGQKVKFNNGKGRSGGGVIKEVRASGRGSWYVIDLGAGEVITLRAAHISAA